MLNMSEKREAVSRSSHRIYIMDIRYLFAINLLERPTNCTICVEIFIKYCAIVPTESKNLDDGAHGVMECIKWLTSLK